MKIILPAIIFCVSVLTSVSAQTAMDFTATDCNSISHNLYTELDSGKVVVLSFVMPCGSCVNPTFTAYNISQSYATSHPGKVLFYVADDDAVTPCTNISNWTTNYIGPGITTFSTPDLDMLNYGQAGMPKILVIGGNNHLIYFNQNNAAAGNAIEIQAAIDLALSEIAGVKQTDIIINNLELFPNPVADKISLNYSSANTQEIAIQVISSLGIVVMEIKNIKSVTGRNLLDLSIVDLSPGLYFVRLVTSSGNLLRKFVIE